MRFLILLFFLSFLYSETNQLETIKKGNAAKYDGIIMTRDVFQEYEENSIKLESAQIIISNKDREIAEKDTKINLYMSITNQLYKRITLWKGAWEKDFKSSQRKKSLKVLVALEYHG